MCGAAQYLQDGGQGLALALRWQGARRKPAIHPQLPIHFSFLYGLKSFNMANLSGSTGMGGGGANRRRLGGLRAGRLPTPTAPYL